MGRPFKCPCGAEQSVSKGIRKTKTMGLRRIRRCKVCGRKFTPKNQKLEEASAVTETTPQQQADVPTQAPCNPS